MFVVRITHHGSQQVVIRGPFTTRLLAKGWLAAAADHLKEDTDFELEADEHGSVFLLRPFEEVTGDPDVVWELLVERLTTDIPSIDQEVL